MFKNFIKWNMLLLCSLIVALFTMTEANGEDLYSYTTCGPMGPATTSQYLMYYNYDRSRSEAIYTSDELGGTPMTIEQLSVFITSCANSNGFNHVTVLLKNTTQSTITANYLTGNNPQSRDVSYYTNLGYEVVLSDVTMNFYDSVGDWYDINFTSNFEYDGTNLSVVFVNNDGTYSGNPSTYWGHYSGTGNQFIYGYADGTNNISSSSILSHKPYIKINDVMIGPPMVLSPSSTTTSQYLMYYNYDRSRSESIYTSNELGGAPVIIEKLSVWVNSTSNASFDNVTVLLKNTTQSTITTNYLTGNNPQARDVSYYTNLGYQVVLSNASMNFNSAVGGWYDINFTSNFDYDGTNLSVVFVNNDGTYVGNPSTYWRHYTGVGNQFIWGYADGTNNMSSSGILSHKPYMRFGYFAEQRYSSSTVYQTENTITSAGSLNVPIVSLNVRIGGNLPPYISDTKVVFDGKYSSTRGQITKARLYYNGKDSIFTPATAVQFGSDITISSGQDISNLTFTGNKQLSGGNNYFWLCYDLSEDCPNGDSVDAKAISFTLEQEGTSTTYTNITTPDPEGKLTVFKPLNAGIYKIGAGESNDFPSLYDCSIAFNQLGVTKNTEIWIMNSLVEDSTCVFGPSPFGDDIVITLRPAPDSVVTITQKTAKIPLLVVNGCRNFQIEGSNAEVLGTGNDRSLTLSSKDVTIAYKNTGYGEIRNLNITGDVGISAFEVESSSNITIANNVVLRSLFGLYCQNSSDLVIYGNFIGDGGDANAVSNGFCLNNSRNVVATNNIFSNIGIKADTANGIIITSNTPLYDANIKFHSNVFNGITAVVEAYGINAKNVSNVEFLHNTIYMTSNAYTGKDPDLVAVMYDKGGNHINSNNNIFCNTVPSSTTTLILTSDMSNNPFNNVDNNVYKSSFVFRTDGTSSQSFSDWQAFMANNGAGKNDANSKLFEGTLNTISKSDYHLDGEAAGSSLLLVPINSLITTDIDGDDRTAFDGQLTFAGADQPVMDYVETDTQLPSSLAICEDSDESELTLTMRKDFVKWVDAARSYIPAVQNTWVRTAFDAPAVFDTLNYDTQDFYVEDPSIYSANPPYTKSGNYRVYSELGYYKFASNNCNVAITKLLTIASEPPADTTACSDASSISVSATLDGSYTALQWEKQNGSNWQNISGQTTATLTLNYTDATQVIGDYRLKVTTPGLCNAPGVIYSEVSHIGVGYPINAANITINQPEENLMTICDGTELIFNVTANGTILSYQWQRYDSATADFIDIPAVVYPSAVTSQFRIPSALAKDAGAYRCRVIGLPSCVGTADVSDTITINITETARILEQPQELIMCYDDVVDDALPVKAYFAASVSGENIAYQWYKDGKAISGADSSVFVFNTLTYKDAGNYQLEIGYSDCKGEPALQYTDAVNLYVYGETEIVTQTNDIYGFAGGYAILNVQAQTKGTQEKVESYQWYRNNIELQDDARFKGTKSSTLVINYLQPQDFNDQTASDYYYCVVQGICNADTSKGARIKPVPEIIIVTQPSSQDKCAGEKAVFEVDASATEVGEPITYQWYKGDGATFTPLADDARITGSNTATLTIDMLELSDADQYYVDVRYVNLSAGISSDKVTLSIEGAPVITKQPVGGKIDLGNTITLSVEIEEQYPGYVCDYQWYKDGSEIFNSNETSITVGNDGIDDAGKYYVIIKSMKGCGETKSNEVTVEVDAGAIVAQGNSFNIISVLPNPLANNATLRYSLEKSGMVSVSIVNIAGATVATLHNGMASSGVNDLEFSVNNLSNGTYYLQLEYNGNKLIHSIIITK